VKNKTSQGGQISPVSGLPRRETYLIRWVAVAAIVPLLGWDVWQTWHEVQARRAVAQAPAPLAAALSRPHGEEPRLEAIRESGTARAN
jgi:hypothetical protein